MSDNYPKLEAGMMVKHATFGLATIVRIQGKASGWACVTDAEQSTLDMLDDEAFTAWCARNVKEYSEDGKTWKKYAPAEPEPPKEVWVNVYGDGAMMTHAHADEATAQTRLKGVVGGITRRYVLDAPLPWSRVDTKVMSCTVYADYLIVREMPDKSLGVRVSADRGGTVCDQFDRWTLYIPKLLATLPK